MPLGLSPLMAVRYPFRNDLASTALTLGLLFGLPALARQLTRSMEMAHPPDGVDPVG